MRSFSLVILSVATWSACFEVRAADGPDGEEKKEKAIAQLKAAGARVAESASGGLEIEFHLSSRRVDDAGLAPIRHLTDVTRLNLRGAEISNDGLEHIAGLKKLRRLHLERTKIGDGGAKHLAGLEKLEYLNLYGTGIGDAGLEHLRGLKELQKLYLWQTKVTDRGCARLRAALPGLKIVRGVDLDKMKREADARKKAAEQIERVDLKWIPAGGADPPRSKSGTFTSVEIKNTRKHTVKLYWVEYGGGLRFYADIAAGAKLVRNTFSEATWLITDEDENRLGSFTVPLKPSRITIPKG